MNPRYIDIHSHLNLSQFDNDREAIIQKLKDENILTITIGTDYESSSFAIYLANQNENLFASVGLHPTDSTIEDFDYEKMLELAKNNKVLAIGECGLDYFHGEDEKVKNIQKELFKKHIELAIEVNKPLMIHARASFGTMDAYIDTIEILKVYKKDYPNLYANFHFFAGDMDIAKRIINLGFSMSFDGPITFAREYDEVIKMIPMDLIMAETDAPFASPVPFRGKRCEPQMVSEVYKKIAGIKGLNEEDVRNQIILNAKRIFNI